MYSWEFSTHKEHTIGWYMVALIIVFVLVAYGILNEIYILSIVTILFAGTYILIENNSTAVTRVEMQEGSMRIGEQTYEFKDMVSFAIISIEDIPSMVRFVPKKKLATQFEVPLTPDVNPQELKNWLLTQLPEDENARFTTTDAIIRMTRL